MSAHPTLSGAISGAVLLIVLVLLAQQFGYVQLSTLPYAIYVLVIPTVVGGLVFGILGGLLGRRARRNAMANPEPASK